MAIWILHGKMTHDALSGFDDNRIKRIIHCVQEVDVFLPHCRGTNHRPDKYQKEFEKYGGKFCPFAGAEYQAARFLESAYRFSREGNKTKAEKSLGYSIHFIQDALCPEHIFPFSEGKNLGPFQPHLSFSVYVALKYGHRGNWSSLVKNAPLIQIFSSEDLRIKLEEAANWIRGFSCSYVREDDREIIDEVMGKTSIWRWKMSDEDIGRWMKKASGLTMGAFLYAQNR